MEGILLSLENRQSGGVEGWSLIPKKEALTICAEYCAKYCVNKLTGPYKCGFRPNIHHKPNCGKDQLKEISETRKGLTLRRYV